MSRGTDVRLDADDVRAYHIQGRQIWVQTDTHEVIAIVPRAQRASFWPRGERATIHIGSMTVSGPLSIIQSLWDTICDTHPTQ